MPQNAFFEIGRLGVMQFKHVLRLLCAVFSCLPGALPVKAAAIAGAEFPDRIVVEGRPLILNGLGVRSYLGFKIYAAALYLVEKSPDEAQIIASPSVRVLKMHYFVDVDQDDARAAWERSFAELCPMPCKFSEEIQQFTRYVSAIKAQDTETYIFSPDGLEAMLKPGQPAVKIAGREFSELVLATWIGRDPPTEDLKQGLLGKLK
ncbi:MAG: hypothetical protein CTY24_08030 [Methylobacter sp.]|nr:MAG: hypothetical protein CTY24_08030 [Methylobacter sp.]